MFRALFLLTACLPGSTIAQAQLFQIRAQQGSVVAPVANGGSISLAASNLGATATVSILITYRGQTKVSIAVPPQLVGSSDFSLVGFPTVAPALSPGDTLVFSMQYHASTSAGVSAALQLSYSEAVPSSAAAGTAPNVGVIQLTFLGTAPSFIISYVFQSDANVIPLNPGGTLTFAPIVINGTSTATLNITNRGSAAGSLDSVFISGSGFQVLGLPLLPLSIGPAQQLQLGIRYAPTDIGSSAGTLVLSIGGVQQTFTLAASSVVSPFSYEYLNGDSTTPVAPSGSISLPDTALAASTSVAIRVRNVISVSSAVTSINVIGQGFALTNPPILPQTLTPNSALVFTLTFSPTLAGSQTGRLQVGNDSFQLEGRGLGAKLTFSYGADAAPVQGGESVLFSPVTVTQTSRKPFTINNSGTSPATVTAIGVVDPRSGFTLEGLPALPLTITPDASVSFTIVFAPAITGFSTTVLRVDNTSFNLSGIGNTPPPLPAYTIAGPSGTVAPFQQPVVSLTLAQPYPVALSGVLNLSAASDTLPTDPAVQFVTGGRSVAFTIAADSTQAIFANGLSQVRLQTGTVAETLKVTPAFATQAGAIDLTPPSPPSLQMQIASAAPQIIGVGLQAVSTTGFTVAITGYSTARSLSGVQLTITPAAKYNSSTLKSTVDISQQSSTWFSLPASVPFGGQFTVLLPLNVTTSPAPTISTTTPAPLSTDFVQNIAVSISNQQGASNSVTLQLH